MSSGAEAQSSGRLTGEQRRNYLEDHIPYRVVAVEGFGWFLEKLQRGEAIRNLSLEVSGRTLSMPYFALTNALVDSGLAHGRALCELLGFSHKRNANELRCATRVPNNKGDDLWMEDLGLIDVKPEVACAIGPEEPEVTEAALIYFLRTASKGVAHMTIEGPSTDQRKLRVAASVIPRLVRRYVYRPLGAELVLDKKHHPCPIEEAMLALKTNGNIPD